MALIALAGVLSVTSISAPTPASAASSLPLMPDAGQYFPITPIKVLDTRDGTGTGGTNGVSAAPLAAGATVSVPVSAVGQIPPGEVTDVYAVVNAISPSADGCLSDYSSDITDPGICNTSFEAGQNVSDSDFIQVGSDGYIDVTNESSGTVDVAVTVMGYVQTDSTETAGDTYASVPETAIADTRSGLGVPKAQIPGGGSLTVQVSGQGGIPATAAGAAVFIGTANATSPGYITAYPSDSTDPGFAALSYVPNRIERDLYFGSLSSSGQLTLVNHGANPVDLVVDVQGYLLDPSQTPAGSTYDGLAPARIVTKDQGQLAAGASLTFAATGVAGVPSSGVSSVTESVAAIGPTANGYLSAYPAGSLDPNQPVVNFDSGDNQDNDLTTAVSANGQETVTNHSSGTVDIVVSVRGYYQAPTVPSAPSELSAGLENGTADISWNVPDTDGGSPITSYALTLYNSDGSVNQTDSYDPSTTSVAISGLTGVGTYSLTLSAVNAAGTGAVATSPINVDTGGGIASSTVSLGGGMEMEIDPDTGNETLDSVEGNTSTYNASGNITSTQAITPFSTDVWTPSTALSGNEDCYKKTEENSGFKGFKPFYSDYQGNSYTVSWLNQTYEVTNARTLYDSNGNPYKTRQWQYCVSGGGDVKNGWHQWFDGLAFTVERTADHHIGRRWGRNKNVNKSASKVSTNLSFSVSAGPVTIGATTSGINPSHGDWSGDIGDDGKFYAYPTTWATNYWKNRTNTFWHSAHTYIWDGTGDYEGETGQTVFEFRMSDTGKYKFVPWVGLKAFCSKVTNDCGSWN
jgi:hypothetical protein